MIKEVSTAVKEDQLKKEAKMQKELMKHCPTLKSVREKQEKAEKVAHTEIQQMIKEVKALGQQGEKGKEMTSAQVKAQRRGR